MTIDNTLERIAVALESIAGQQGVIKPVIVQENVVDTEGEVETVVNKEDNIFGGGEPATTETKTETKTKAKTTAKKAPAAKKGKTLSFDDVKGEARVLVDLKDGREGFEKAQKILKKLGAPSLKDLIPEKYADAINAFRKAVKAWK